MGQKWLQNHNPEVLSSIHETLFNVFHKFRQGKFAYGVSILSSSQFSLLPQLSHKNGIGFKSGQNWLENNHLATLIYIL